jgi:hypothetical protein
MSKEKRSKVERSELKCKLESMEEKDDSREVSISVVPKLHLEIPKQPPLEPFDKVPAEKFNEAMMKDE